MSFKGTAPKLHLAKGWRSFMPRSRGLKSLIRIGLKPLTPLRPQSHQYVDPANLIALGRLRQILNTEVRHVDIGEGALIFEEEMEVVRGFGVEIGFRALDRHLTKEARFDKLMKRVVNGRQRDRNAVPHRFRVERFCRQMTVAAPKQKLRERDALTRGAEATRTKPLNRKFWNILGHFTLQSSRLSLVL